MARQVMQTPTVVETHMNPGAQNSMQWEQFIRRIAEIPSQVFEMETVLDMIVRELGRFFQVDLTTVALYRQDNNGYAIDLWKQFCLNDEDSMNWKAETTPSLVHAASRLNTVDEALEVIHADSAEEYLQYWRNRLRKNQLPEPEIQQFEAQVRAYFQRNNIQSFLRIGIAYKGTPYGALTMLQSTVSKSWNPVEIGQIQDIANLLGSILYQSDLFAQEQYARQALQRSLERERLTRRVVELANQGLDFSPILDTIAQEVGQFFQSDRAFVTNLEQEGECYYTSLIAQFTRSEEVPPLDFNTMPVRMREKTMSRKPASELMTVYRISSKDEHLAFMRHWVDKENLPPEEAASLYQEIVEESIERQGTRAFLRVPIVYRGIPYGSITLQQCLRDRVWQDEEVTTLQEIATQVGTVFYQTQLYREERLAKEALVKSFEREQLIRKIVETIGRSFDIDVILHTIAEETGRYLNTDRTGVSRHYMEDGKLIIVASGQYCRPGIRPADPEDIELILKAVQHLDPESLVEGEEHVTNIPDQEQYLNYIRTRMDFYNLPGLPTEKLLEMIHKYEVRSSLKVHIRYRGKFLGSINLSQVTHNRQWLPDEVELVKTIAEHAGSAIYQAELYRQEQLAKEEAETRLKRESLLRNVVEVINQSLDVSVILNTIAQELLQFLQVDRVLLSRFTVDDEHVNVLHYAQSCSDETIVPITHEDIQLLFRAMKKATPEFLEEGRDQLICISDMKEAKARYLPQMTASLGQGPDLERATQLSEIYNVQATLRVGIFYRGTPFGSIGVHQCGYQRQWQPEDIELLNTVGDHLALALAQAELYTAEQTARQEAETANRKKSEFLAMMSHELRTPLNAIIGYSRMMENGMAGALTEKQHRYVENVCVSGSHLLNIVNDLLDFAKVEAGKMDIHPQPLDVAPLMSEIQSMMSELAKKKTIALTFHTAPELAVIEVDPSRFKQIFINLINNAIKFNRLGGSVWVRLYPTPDQQWLVGEVQDTGIGISKETLPNLFKKFYQADTSISRKHEGTGLGLALTKELVELHGGSITVDSEEGLGTTLQFKLPFFRPL